MMSCLSLSSSAFSGAPGKAGILHRDPNCGYDFSSPQEASILTPVPTPQATPPPTPPPEKEVPQVKTPYSSPSPPEMSEDVLGHEKIKETGIENNN